MVDAKAFRGRAQDGARRNQGGSASEALRDHHAGLLRGGSALQLLLRRRVGRRTPMRKLFVEELKDVKGGKNEVNIRCLPSTQACCEEAPPCGSQCCV